MAREAERLRLESEALSAAVADALPVLRSSANLSQSSFAVLSGTSQAYVSQIETGTRTSSTAILRVTEALHTYNQRAAADLARAREGTT